MLNRLVNFFVPPQETQRADRLRLARIRIIVFLLSAFLNLLYIGSALQYQFHPVEYVLLANALLCLVTAFLLKWGVPGWVCVHLHMFNQTTSAFVTIVLGSGLESPSTVGIVLMPILALLLSDVRNSLVWLVVSLVFSGGLFYYESTYGPLPSHFDEPYRLTYLFSSVLGVTAALFACALVFYHEKARAVDTLIRTNLELIGMQEQLIQKEKMASLGELTAGIAHEIQNPLNFVNNFSDVSGELVEELKETLRTPEQDPSLVTEILHDLTQNLEKIHHHGRRADSIVKGMLQHSRASGGEKQPTRLNDLTDEYLRIAYHGFRAKDKAFNVTLTTRFDPQLGKVNVAPQELGRVLLNLFNNAFYATDQKRKLQQNGYLPEVTVSTQKTGNRVEIRVQDNGTGVPAAVKQKIFQPFFTTKPTGEGTGLGLSLSYDIVTKGHGGELSMESREGEGTEFVIRLPAL
ncbi:His Kinase A (phospho-acceptor) domain-containing protein [Catalinimonas alkaloidigena]|uniref:histidine kinase n=1 Tax=Catalinimonas alkaloidigena TaxID=1075417 RepID=A0A1G9QCV4_9BACT|nr:ATP-binding protein [Catalinimonas alkaloidigena]SDM08205.1 His Kinase A (phospho-acceptor) domain-containing protein [Catalinimonas alkaloidigena]